MMIRKTVYTNLLYPAYRYIKKDKAIQRTRELEQNQWLSRDQLEELQHNKLTLLLRHASENVPYYRKILEKTGLDPEKFAQLSTFAFCLF
jgi:phenylacetate-CoA ligase